MANNKSVIDRILNNVDNKSKLNSVFTPKEKSNIKTEKVKAVFDNTPLMINKKANPTPINPQPSKQPTPTIKIKREVNPLKDINRNTLVHILSDREKTFSKKFNIKVIGIGGAGNNIVKYMVNSQEWADFVTIIALNTDYVALSSLGSNLQNIFILGADELNGNGSGGNPNVGKAAAESDVETIKTILEGTDVLILVAGLGKGTGTGATPVIAKAAQDLDILTIGLFNLPSIGAEGDKTYKNALEGLQQLSLVCNGLTTVNNDKIINTDKEKMSIKKAYEGANKYIKTIVEEIITIITKASDINVDFADVKNFFEDKNGFLFLRLYVSDYTKDALKEVIEESIRLGFSDVNIKHSEKALINFKLNENVPSIVLENTRSALKDIVDSGNVNIVHGVGYNDVYQDAEINILLTGTFELDDIEDFNPQMPEPQPLPTTKKESHSIYETLKNLETKNSQQPRYDPNDEILDHSYPATLKMLKMHQYDTDNLAKKNFSPPLNKYQKPAPKRKTSWLARLFYKNKNPTNY